MVKERLINIACAAPAGHFDGLGVGDHLFTQLQRSVDFGQGGWIMMNIGKALALFAAVRW